MGSWCKCLGHANLIPCSTDPTDPIFADTKKIKDKGQDATTMLIAICS